jgi:Right handed beta helix region
VLAVALVLALGVSACGAQTSHQDEMIGAGRLFPDGRSSAAVGVHYEPPPSPACTQTFPSVSAASSALDSAASGAAICLSAGSYGPLALSGTHTGNVTIEPVPGTAASVEGVSVAADASHITIHDFDISGGLTMQAGDSYITVDHNDIDGQGPGGEGEGVQDISVNCSAPGAPTYSGCTATAPDTYLTINGNEIHGYGQGKTEDAIHLNNWEHVTITANDIYNLEEHGNHTDAMQSVFGGHHMLFERNYEHDNQSQGFFINDGDAGEVTVNDNLFLRNDNEPKLYPGGEYNIQVFNTTGLTITNNTVWDGQDDILRAEGAAAPLTATVSHNVEQTLNVLHEGGGPAYALQSHDNVFAQAPWTIPLGTSSQVIHRLRFVDPTGGDYRLRRNPHEIGVDWQPSEYIYGPTGD